MYQPDLPDTSSSPTISTNLNWNQCATIPPHMLFDYQLTNQTSLVKWLYQPPLTIAKLSEMTNPSFNNHTSLRQPVYKPYLSKNTNPPLTNHVYVLNNQFTNFTYLRQTVHQLYLSETTSSSILPIETTSFVSETTNSKTKPIVGGGGRPRSSKASFSPKEDMSNFSQSVRGFTYNN